MAGNKRKRNHKRERHREHWEFNVAKLAMMDPKVHESLRLTAHNLLTLTPSAIYSFKAVLERLGEDSNDRNARYLMRTLKRVTPAPKPMLIRGDADWTTFDEVADIRGDADWITPDEVADIKAMGWSKLRARVAESMRIPPEYLKENGNALGYRAGRDWRARRSGDRR